MTSVNVGSTNIDGTGSATNLNDAYSVLPLLNESTEDEGFSASLTEDLLAISANYWNALAAKELQVTAKNINIEATDFVDVDINLESSEEDVEVTVYNSKRGEINTGSGDDTVIVTVQSNDAGWDNEFVVSTGEGDDFIILDDASNSHLTGLNIDAGDGDDYIDIFTLNANVGSADERILDGGEGDDVIFGADGSETIFGGSGDDAIYAENGDNVIDGGEGDDYIDAGDGDDVINGGEGEDNIDAGDGDNVINGGEGNDYIYAGNGDDVINGGEGYDFIDAGEGNDIIYSGSGSDGIIFDSADEKIDGGEGLDALFVTGDSTIVNVENIELISGEGYLYSENGGSASSAITMALTDGLVVSLGGDDGDSLTFTNADSFTLSDATLSDSMLDFISEFEGVLNIDVDNLTAFESNFGDTVWTDVDLLA